MSALRRAAVLLCAFALAATACTSPAPEPDPITVGIPGSDKWPGEGSLVHDDSLRKKVSSLLVDWSPPGQGKITKSRLLWAGRIDGTVLAVADVQPSNVNRDWQVELSGPGIDQLSVTASSAYRYAPSAEDVRALRSPCCAQRYLVSTKVTSLTVTGGSPLAVKDFVSDRAPFAKCSPGGLEAKYDSSTADYVDLGTSLPFGYGDTGNGALLDALRGLNTCGGPLPPDLVSLSRESTHTLTIPPAGPGQLIELNWQAPGQDRRISLVWRPDGGPAPTFSPSAAYSDRLAVFHLDLPSGPVIALTWPTVGSYRVALPTAVTPLIDSSGLTVFVAPTAPIEVKLMFNDQLSATQTVS
jgi:hypothetical protein